MACADALAFFSAALIGLQLHLALQDGSISILDVNAASVSATLASHTGAVWGLTLLPDSSGFVSCSADHTLRQGKIKGLSFALYSAAVLVPADDFTAHSCIAASSALQQCLSLPQLAAAHFLPVALLAVATLLLKLICCMLDSASLHASASMQ